MESQMEVLTATQKNAAIRELSRRVGRYVTKLETGDYLDKGGVISLRDEMARELMALGHEPAFLRERCRKLSAADPEITPLPAFMLDGGK
jgi:predicted transcriptional regulator